MHNRGRLALTAVLLLGAACAAYAQDRDGERARLEAELKRYHSFINAYRSGDDTAVDEILAWDAERLPKIVAAAGSSLDVFKPWDEARVKAATMLHTDAAFRLIERDEKRSSYHLELAARLVALGGRDLHAFARRWYTAVSRLLRDRVQLFVAEGLLERGRESLPGDAAILYESGVLQEQIATYAAFITIVATELPVSRGHGIGMQGMSSASASGTNRSLGEQRKALDSAARFFRQALEADSSSELTALHLARVQMLRGNDDDAAQPLQRLAASVDADTAYLATMFLGAMHQRRGRHDDAAAKYRSAIDKNPGAQSAYVALSEVQQKLGRGDEARSTLLALLERPATERTEPWWWYLVEPVGEARARVDAIRVEVRK